MDLVLSSSPPDSELVVSTELDAAAESPATMSTSPALPPKSFPREQLPYELRDQIFGILDETPDFTSYFRWRGSIPSLVIVLRPSSISYSHVLQWWRKCNSSLYLVREFGYSIEIMNECEAEVIKEVTIGIK